MAPDRAPGGRVLFVTRKFPPSIGGMEIYSRQIHEAFGTIGADVHLFKPAQDMIGRPSIAQVARFFASACAFIMRNARRFDAILIGDYALASLAPVAKLASAGRIRTVVALHGNDLYFMRGTSASALAYRAISRCIVASGTLDAAVANSDAIRDEATSRGLQAVHVVPLATVVPDLPDAWRAGRRRQLLFAGRLIRYKGLSWFMQHVWPRLDGSLRLVVAGAVWDDAERAAIEDQPRVEYLGPVPFERVAELRATSLACIMPNLPPGPTEQDEGFGLAALEGPAVGTPTIASRCGGLPAAVSDQVTGFLLPPLDADAWVACINAVAAWTDDERERFSARARTHLREHYDWTLVARRTLAILQGADAGAIGPATGAH